jgi:DNA-directed RNA polymerase sigma subunit (sigma70/sigma32)
MQRSMSPASATELKPLADGVAPSLRLVRDEEPAVPAKTSIHPRRLEPEEERTLARAWRNDNDTAARNKLIESHIGLVIAIARGLSNRGVALEDLIAEGNIGLIRAVDNYDPELGFRLATFAFQHIRHAMVALIAANSPRGKLRHEARRKIARWETAVASLTASRGVPPR